MTPWADLGPLADLINCFRASSNSFLARGVGGQVGRRSPPGPGHSIKLISGVFVDTRATATPELLHSGTPPLRQSGPGPRVLHGAGNYHRLAPVDFGN